MGPFGDVLGPSSGHLRPSWDPLGGVLGAGSNFNAVLGRTWGVLGASWDPLGGILGASWGHLGPSWRPLGGLLGPLGGLLGRLGGQDPPEARGRRVFEASWGRLGLIFGRFLDGFWSRFSTLFLSYPTRRQHVVKPQNYYICSTGEPFKALRGQYFSSTFKYFRGL